MARAVPMPWAAAPRANPRASGSRTPQRRRIHSPKMLPKIPTQKTTTDVTETLPPSGPATDTAMGTVTDLGAMELRICRSAPNAMAI